MPGLYSESKSRLFSNSLAFLLQINYSAKDDSFQLSDLLIVRANSSVLSTSFSIGFPMCKCTLPL